MTGTKCCLPTTALHDNGDARPEGTLTRCRPPPRRGPSPQKGAPNIRAACSVQLAARRSPCRCRIESPPAHRRDSKWAATRPPPIIPRTAPPAFCPPTPTGRPPALLTCLAQTFQACDAVPALCGCSQGVRGNSGEAKHAARQHWVSTPVRSSAHMCAGRMAAGVSRAQLPRAQAPRCLQLVPAQHSPQGGHPAAPTAPTSQHHCCTAGVQRCIRLASSCACSWRCAAVHTPGINVQSSCACSRHRAAVHTRSTAQHSGHAAVRRTRGAVQCPRRGRYPVLLARPPGPANCVPCDGCSPNK
jgi:hypothetical protein